MKDAVVKGLLGAETGGGVGSDRHGGNLEGRPVHRAPQLAAAIGLGDLEAVDLVADGYRPNVPGLNVTPDRLDVISFRYPDKRDALAGLSAREYAAQDGRNSAILGIIERGVQPEEPKKSGELDFSGIGEQK